MRDGNLPRAGFQTHNELTSITSIYIMAVCVHVYYLHVILKILVYYLGLLAAISVSPPLESILSFSGVSSRPFSDSVSESVFSDVSRFSASFTSFLFSSVSRFSVLTRIGSLQNVEKYVRMNCREGSTGPRI